MIVMEKLRISPSRLIWLSSVGASLAVAAPSWAGQICVDCAEPAAIYNCTFKDEDLAALKLPQTAAQVVCMTELAKQGGHRFCRVSQGQMGGLCSGQERQISLSGRGVNVTAPVPEGSPDGVQPKAPPATLADLAKETAKSSNDSLKKAGDAIKSGAEKVGDGVGQAVDCVFSLFKRC
jgi:hypothetical protein